MAEYRILLRIIALFMGLFLISGISGCEDTEPISFPGNISSVSLANHTFEIEIADNDAERAKGLMFREALNNSSGMLFIYADESIRGFWMRNTLIPLDMIFADKNLKIVDINSNARPCADKDCHIYYSNAPAQYILEINGGLSEELNISVGDKIKIFNLR